jgi:hypothetical protein
MIKKKVGQDLYELRPQCARSTLGRHDHNDIFIMEGQMYTLKGNCLQLQIILLLFWCKLMVTLKKQLYMS